MASMPTSKSGLKSLKASKRRRTFNDRRRVELKSAVKEVRTHTSKGDAKKAEEKLSDAYKAIDKALKRGIIKKNTAARKKSRLSKSITANKK